MVMFAGAYVSGSCIKAKERMGAHAAVGMPLLAAHTQFTSAVMHGAVEHQAAKSSISSPLRVIGKPEWSDSASALRSVPQPGRTYHRRR